MFLISSQVINLASSAYSTLRILFDGVDEYLYKVSPSFQGDKASGGRTMAFWVEFPALDSTNGVNAVDIFAAIGNDDVTTHTPLFFFEVRSRASGDTQPRFGITYRQDKGGAFSAVNSAKGTDTIVTTNTKYHVVFSTNGSTTKIYVNGVAETMGTWAGSNQGWWFGDLNMSGTKTFVVGTGWNNNGPTNHTNAYVDEITYWNKQLSSSEVTELYNSGVPMDPTAHSAAANLDGHWRMGETESGSITTVYDSVNSDDFSNANMENGDIVSVSY